MSWCRPMLVIWQVDNLRCINLILMSIIKNRQREQISMMINCTKLRKNSGLFPFWNINTKVEFGKVVTSQKWTSIYNTFFLEIKYGPTKSDCFSLAGLSSLLEYLWVRMEPTQWNTYFSSRVGSRIICQTYTKLERDKL